MPTFFQFHQGNESRTRIPAHDSSPLLGRFRAVPPRPGLGRRRSSNLGLLSSSSFGGLSGRGSVHVGYGAVIAAQLGEGGGSDDDDDELDSEYADDDEDDEDCDEDGEDGRGRRWRTLRRATTWSWWRRKTRRAWRRTRRWSLDLWIDPKQLAVKRVLDVWWSRYGLLVLLPAVLAVAWCAIPFPKYHLHRDDDDDGGSEPGHSVPGHGPAKVRVNFWFFLFVYYGLYNLTALIWITKVFNLYNLNWWPQSLGFPLTISLIALLSISIPIPIFLSPQSRFLTVHNTAWISWTFIVMAVPVATAFLILMTNERHLGLRTSLSDTQRIFTTSWWTGDGSVSDRARGAAASRRHDVAGVSFDEPDAALLVADGHGRGSGRAPGSRRFRRRWFPASFVRFLWFCIALFVGLMAYVIGEAYSEIYLRTLPHNNLETILYVYSWVATVHLLDALTGWILGIREGERVGSYPLSWVFKLYFMLTYQTYVRALYARLRSPNQFIILQALSSSSLIILTPLMMSPLFHRVITALGFSEQSYPSYQKLCLRNVFIRFLAENVSMAAFLGSILVLHFGPNKDVYPHFAFDGSSTSDGYTFELTFYASAVTWACELAAALCVRLIIAWWFRVDVGLEGKLDLAVWPELLPTCVAVMLHVLQNMLFSIIRLQFR